MAQVLDQTEIELDLSELLTSHNATIRSLNSDRLKRKSSYYRVDSIQTRTGISQGGLVPIKSSGAGTNFGLLVHVLPRPN